MEDKQPKVTLEILPNGETMRHVEFPSGIAFSYIGLGCLTATQTEQPKE
jgi:hypothetical protein